jgi:Holliday junction resolvase RusA-like endonuclease
VIQFTVYGKAAASGLRPVPIRKGGEVIGSRLAEGRNREQAHRIRGWKDQVAQVAAEAMVGRELLSGPLAVEFTFFSPRPHGHFGTGRNSGKLKDSAPGFPVTRPDVLKLARLVEDSLSGIGVPRRQPDRRGTAEQALRRPGALRGHGQTGRAAPGGSPQP